MEIILKIKYISPTRVRKRKTNRIKTAADTESSSDTSDRSTFRRPSKPSSTQRQLNAFHDTLITSLEAIDDRRKRKVIRIDLAQRFFALIAEDEISDEFKDGEDGRLLKLFANMLTEELRLIEDEQARIKIQHKMHARLAELCLKMTEKNEETAGAGVVEERPESEASSDML